MFKNQDSDVSSARRARSLTRPVPPVGAGTLAIWPGYGTGNPRFCVSGWFTSLVNCGELVNPPYSLGELDI